MTGLRAGKWPAAVAGLLRLAVLSVASAGMWIPVHLYFGGYARLGGPPVSWYETLLLVLVKTARWIMVMPFVIVVAERLQLRKPHLLRDSLFLSALLSALSFIAPLLTLEITLTAWLDDRSTHGVTPSVALAGLAIMFGYILSGREQVAAVRRRRRELEALLTRTRLELFRARIAPRFLFSVLDEIARTVRSDPARAEQRLLDFADLLRALMDINREHAIPFERELDVIDRFIAVMVRAPFVATSDDESLQAVVEPLALFRIVASLTTLVPRSMRVDARAGREITVDLVLELPQLLLAREASGLGAMTLRECVRSAAVNLSTETRVDGSTAVIRVKLPFKAASVAHEALDRNRCRRAAGRS
jgi:hypothetical protein